MALPSRLFQLSRQTRTLSTPLARQAFITATDHPYPEPPPPLSLPDADPHANPRPHHVVVSIAGQDRIGIVSTFTSTATQHNANMEQSKMTLLGGDFAMIAHLRMEHDVDAEKMARKLRSELKGFTITVRMTTSAPHNALPPTGRLMWRLQLVGPDQPGIVSAVAQVLVAYGANVHEIDTDVFAAPFSGEALFRMNGKIAIDELMIEAVSTGLTHIEDLFGSTISLEQISDRREF